MINKQLAIDLLCFILLITIIISVWFRAGLMIGGGESGLPFGNLKEYLYLSGSTWTDGLLGFPTTIGLVSFTEYFILNKLAAIGIQSVALQAGTFWLILFIAGFFTYLSVLDLFKKPLIARTATLFYLFNMYVIFNIWVRLQYPYIFFYALLPSAFYFFFKGLQTRKYIFLIPFNIVCLFLSDAYGDLPALELWWFVLFLYSIFFAFVNKTALRYSILYFVISITSWSLFNAWWILPFVNTLTQTSYITTIAASVSNDLSTFLAESQMLGNLAYVFRFEHAFYLNLFTQIWGNIYYSPLFILFSFCIPFLAFFPLFTKKIPKGLYFFLFLSLLLIFLMKGSEAPFGGIFLFLFTHIRLLEPFRNPFEKFGLAISFSFAPLVGYGVYTIYQWFYRESSIIASGFVIVLYILLFGVLVFPMWNGWIFTNPYPPANNLKIGDSVLVPTYYSEARNYLNSQPGEFRIIGLPMSPGEGVLNTWSYGYNGVDLLNALLGRPVISLCTSTEYLCSITTDIEPLLLQYPNDYWKMLPSLNAKYLLLRSDINYVSRFSRNPTDILKILNIPTSNIVKDKEFGKLTFYKVINANPQLIFSSNDGIYADSGNQSYISVLPLVDFKNNIIFFTDPTKKELEISHSRQSIIKAEPYTVQHLNVSEASALNELPYVRYLPTSKLYLLIKFKEAFDLFLSGNQNFSEFITESDKRAVEITRLITQENRYDLAQNELKEYQNYLQYFINNPGLFDQTHYKQDIVRQSYIIADARDYLKQKNRDITDIQSTLELLHILKNKLGIEPLYPVNQEKYQSFHFSIPSKGTYAIILQTRGTQQFFNTDSIIAVIDGKKKVNVQIGKNTLDVLANSNFTMGNHQIDLLYPNSPKNLVQTSNIRLTSHHVTQQYSYNLSPFDPFTTYKLSFDYTVNKGNAPQFYITEDTDSKTDGKLNPKESFPLTGFEKTKRMQHFEAQFTPDTYAHSLKLVFTVWPQNFCLDKNKGTSALKCKQESYSSKFDVASDISISNLEFTKHSFGDVFITVKNSYPKLDVPQVTYQKISPAIYKVHIQNAKNPFFLAFLQSYHSLWKAYILDSNNKMIPVNEKNHILINSFANSWYIDKKGSYSLLLEFTPEDLFKNGTLISKAAMIISLIILFWQFVVLKIKKGRKK